MRAPVGDPLPAVLAAFDEYHTLGVTVERRFDALLVRDLRAPMIYDANHVRRIRTAKEALDDLFAAADERFAALPYRSFRVDPLTPPGVEARLALEGYDAQEELIMLLEGEVRGARATPDIREVATEADWRCWWELKELSNRQAGIWEATGTTWFEFVRRKCPPVRYFLTRDEGRPTGYLSAFVAYGVGYLEDLYVHPEYRLRGLATALVARCDAEARSRGATVTFLPALVNDTPKRMYARMGFRPLAVVRSYWRRVTETPKPA